MIFFLQDMVFIHPSWSSWWTKWMDYQLGSQSTW